MSVATEISRAVAEAYRSRAPNAEESLRVETLRGVACILLVLFHVIGSPTTGLKVADDSVWRFLTEVFEPLRMPLFTFLSGFVYAYRPVTAGAGPFFARAKVRRLILPLIAAGSVHFILQTLAPGTSHKMSWGDMWRIYIFPYEHFWFLQAILLIFILAALIDHFALLSSPRRWLAALGIALVVNHWASLFPDFFSIGKAAYLLPYFVAGLGANRFGRALAALPLKPATALVFVAVMTPYAVTALTADAVMPGPTSPWVTLISLSGILSLMWFAPPAKALAWVGGFSFSIYLYHVIFTAGTRIMLGKFGIASLPLHVVLGLGAGIAGPIVVELLLRRHRLARNVFLGRS